MQHCNKFYFDIWQRNTFLCRLDQGCAVPAFKYDEDESAHHEERDVFRMEKRLMGDVVRLKRIHLYGTHVTEYENRLHKFDPIKVKARRVIYYLADTGSIVAVESNDRIIHFCAADPRWNLVIVSSFVHRHYRH